MSDANCGCPPVDAVAGCGCAPRTVECGCAEPAACKADGDIRSTLVQGVGGKKWRILLQTSADQVLLDDGTDVETRLKTFEAALQHNSFTRFALNIAERDALKCVDEGDRCYVVDASDDPEVENGGAMYVWRNGRWVLLYKGDIPLDAWALIKKDRGLNVEDNRLVVDLTRIVNQANGLLVDGNGLLNLVPADFVAAGNGLGIDENGHLYANPSDMANTLAGHALNASGGKLNVVESELAAGLAGPGLKTADGKLALDAATLPQGQIALLAYLLVQPGGGLAMDENGRIYVDFSHMPTDKFEALMKSLRLPLYISSTLNVYVDQLHAAASDALDDGRGLSAALPFRTIQAALNMVAENYNLGAYGCYINIAPGTYTENLTLPSYVSTTGGVVLRPYRPRNESGYPKIICGANSNFGIYNNSGKTYYLLDLDIEYRPAYTSASPQPIYGLLANGAGSDIVLQGGTITFADGSGTTGNANSLNLITAFNGGAIDFQPCELNQRQLTITCNKSGAWTKGSLSVFYAENSSIVFRSGDVSEASSQIIVDGHWTNFIHSNASSSVGRWTSRAYLATFGVKSGGEAAGRRYLVENGSNINTGGGGAEFFPGTTAGAVDAGSFSWYK